MLFYQQIMMYHIEKQLIGVQNIYISIKETVMKCKNHFNLMNLHVAAAVFTIVIIIVIIMKYRLILQMMYQQHDLDYKHVGLRLYEWIDVGSIPVIAIDDAWLPGRHIPWNQMSIRISESLRDEELKNELDYKITNSITIICTCYIMV